MVFAPITSAVLRGLREQPAARLERRAAALHFAAVLPARQAAALRRADLCPLPRPRALRPARPVAAGWPAPAEPQPHWVALERERLEELQARQVLHHRQYLPPPLPSPWYPPRPALSP